MVPEVELRKVFSIFLSNILERVICKIPVSCTSRIAENYLGLPSG
jgi:hypothetical protein